MTFIHYVQRLTNVMKIAKFNLPSICIYVLVFKGPRLEYKIPSNINFNKCKLKPISSLGYPNISYVLFPAHKTAINVIVVCRLHYRKHLKTRAEKYQGILMTGM